MQDKTFLSVTQMALKEVGKLSRDHINRGVPVLKKNLAGVGAKTLDPTELILAYTPNQRDWVRGNLVGKKSIEAVDALANLHDKAMAVKNMIVAMRAIYEPGPDVNVINEKYFNDQQKVIDESLKEWVRIGSSFIFWLSDEVHLNTVAFLLAITILAKLKTDNTLRLGQKRYPFVVTVNQKGEQDIILP
jgi:hypothetical protein